jgi:Zn-dependent peptidase ImmA (M78 family)
MITMPETTSDRPSEKRRLTRSEKVELAQEAMHASMEVRFEIGLGIEEPICVYAACERLGVPVRFVDFNLEGIYRPGPPKIILSAFRPLGRRNFNCAHEQGHWYFKHAATLDELADALEQYDDETPEELLANSFASHFLMPALGVRRAFARRNLRASNASPEQIQAVASEFGVTYGALVTHLWISLGDISFEYHKALMHGRQGLKRLLAAQGLNGAISLLDEEFAAPTLDVEVEHIILAPTGSVSECDTLSRIGDMALGTLFRTVKRGLAEIHLPKTAWSASIRIAPKNFVGLAKYRHLEEDE